MWVIVVAAIVAGDVHVHVIPHQFPTQELCESAASGMDLTPDPGNSFIVVCDRTIEFGEHHDFVPPGGMRRGPFKPEE